MYLFDAHCHLPAGDFAAMLERSAQADVVEMVLCGTSPSDWDRVLATAEKNQHSISLWPMIGIHPWFVSKDRKTDFQTLEQIVRDDPTIGMGETGLDFQKRFSNRIEQEESFAAHLDLARELDRPIAVHCVQAWGRLIEVLREHPAPRILLHAFGGSVELIPELIELNGWFSFGGAVMNPQSKRARAAVVAVPADRLLIETDSKGEPEKLINIARTVAELRGVSVEEIAELTFQNGQLFFNHEIY